MPVVELEDVDFSHPGGPLVLQGVSLRLDRGELLAVAGPNGGGKTTLMRLIAGLERPTAGTIERFGEPVRSGRGDRRLGYLPQRAEAALSAPITVHELVTAGRAPVRGVTRSLDADDAAAIDAAIERVGLTALARRPLRSLSGGQRQRAFIAKALAANPELLILDEPSAGVDVAAQSGLAELIAELRAERGMAVLYVSHEFGAIEAHVERLLIISRGVAFDGPPGESSDEWHDPSHGHPRH